MCHLVRGFSEQHYRSCWTRPYVILSRNFMNFNPVTHGTKCRKKKRYMYTVEEVQWETEWSHQGWIRKKTPIHHLMGQNRRMIIIYSRPRVKSLDTGILDYSLFVKNQLLRHPVIIRRSNVCCQRLSISHDLSGQGALRRPDEIPPLRSLLNEYIVLINLPSTVKLATLHTWSYRI